MLDGSEFFVVLKLCSGEQVMAVLREEEDDRILLETPMVMRSIPVLETGREHITAHPLCQFSDDKIYVIQKRDVMFCKKLHHVFIPHYMKIVKEHEETSFISKENKELLEHWDDADQITVEEAKKRIEMLAELLRSKPEEEEEEIPLTLVRGNDTVH
jgi:hypothetical protein